MVSSRTVIFLLLTAAKGIRIKKDDLSERIIKGVYMRTTKVASAGKTVSYITSRNGGIWAFDARNQSLLGCFSPRVDDEITWDTNGYGTFTHRQKVEGRNCTDLRHQEDDGNFVHFEGQARLGNIFAFLSICQSSSPVEAIQELIKIDKGHCNRKKVNGIENSIPMLYIWRNIKEKMGAPDQIIALEKWEGALHVDFGTIVKSGKEYLVAFMSSGFNSFAQPGEEEVAGVIIAEAPTGVRGAVGRASSNEFSEFPVDFTLVNTKVDVTYKSVLICSGGVAAFNTDGSVQTLKILGPAPEGSLLIPSANKLYGYTAGVNGEHWCRVRLEIDNLNKLKVSFDGLHTSFEDAGIKLQQMVSRSFKQKVCSSASEEVDVIVASNFFGKGHIHKYIVNDTDGSVIRSGRYSRPIKSERRLFHWIWSTGSILKDIIFAPADKIKVGSVLGAIVTPPGFSNPFDKIKISSGANRIILFRVLMEDNEKYCTFAVSPFKKPAGLGVFDVSSAGVKDEKVTEVKFTEIDDGIIYAAEIMPPAEGESHTFKLNADRKVEITLTAPVFNQGKIIQRKITFTPDERGSPCEASLKACADKNTHQQP